MKKQPNDYQSYKLEDLINDQDFMLWVLNPNEKLNGHWQSVQDTYPQLNTSILQAKKIILSLRFETEPLEDKVQQELWNKISSQTTLIEKPVRKVSLWYPYVAAAAVVAVLFCVGIIYSINQKVSVNTPYGQLKTISLPDGSLVTLNANSKIKYDKNWDKDEIREVWIEGEAFLKVNHLHKTGAIQKHERFIVHTGAVNVEVLGTSFNVNDRRGRTEVALLDGKISLGLNTDVSKQLILAPGDIAEYAGGKLSKKTTNVAEYSAWRDGKLYFKNVPLSKVLEYFEDIYGYKAVVDDPKILDKKLSGNLSTKDRAVFLSAIAMTLNIDIKQKDETKELIITSK